MHLFETLQNDVERNDDDWKFRVNRMKNPYDELLRLQEKEKHMYHSPEQVLKKKKTGLFGMFTKDDEDEDLSPSDMKAHKTLDSEKILLEVDESPFKTYSGIKGMYLYGSPGSSNI